MKSRARHLLRLYPRTWRNRYAHELESLLEDSRASWTHIPDIMQEAFRMRLALANWPPIAAFALAGLVASAIIAVQTPPRYISTAKIAIHTPAADFPKNRAELERIAGDVQSRKALIALMLSPALDLYRQQREQNPIEDSLMAMRKDLTLDLTYPDNNTIQRVFRSWEKARHKRNPHCGP